MNKVSETYPELGVLDLNEVFEQARQNPADAKAQEQKQVAIELLTQIHQGVYVQTFPLPEEQEALEDWLERLERGFQPTGENQFFHIMGKNLDNPAQAEIVGFEVTAYYPESETALINYVIKEKAYARNNTEGNPYYEALPMMDHAVEYLEQTAQKHFGGEIKAIFWESNDPALTPYDPANPNPDVDCMDPAKRIDLVEKKFGYQQVNMDYVQGDIGEGECETLRLYMCKDSKGKHIGSAEDVKNFLIEFNDAFNDGRSLQTEAGVKMMEQVEAMVRAERPLLVGQEPPSPILPKDVDINISRLNPERERSAAEGASR